MLYCTNRTVPQKHCKARHDEGRLDVYIYIYGFSQCHIHAFISLNYSGSETASENVQEIPQSHTADQPTAA